MQQVAAKDLVKKIAVRIDDAPYLVLEVKFVTPSARGASMMAKVKVRNLITGAVFDKTFTTAEKFEVLDVEKVPAVFLYLSGEEYCFMDNATYDQFSFSAKKLDQQRFYLKEGFELQALKLNGTVISLELPVYVELAVTETEPSIKGATAQGRALKNARLETGLDVQVPPYIEIGDRVRVNTETGEIDGRA